MTILPESTRAELAGCVARHQAELTRLRALQRDHGLTPELNLAIDGLCKWLLVASMTILQAKHGIESAP